MWCVRGWVTIVFKVCLEQGRQTREMGRGCVDCSEMKQAGSVDLFLHLPHVASRSSRAPSQTGVRDPAVSVDVALLFCFLYIYAIYPCDHHPHLLYEIALKVNSTTAKVPADTGIALTHVGRIPLQKPPIPPCLQVCLKQSVIDLYF